MRKKRLESNGGDLSNDLWVNPRSNFKHELPRWGERNINMKSGERFLELADIALGLKKPNPRRRKAAVAASASHETRKAGPYSN